VLKSSRLTASSTSRITGDDLRRWLEGLGGEEESGREPS
jgi:hypothetical protein